MEEAKTTLGGRDKKKTTLGGRDKKKMTLGGRDKEDDLGWSRPVDPSAAMARKS